MKNVIRSLLEDSKIDINVKMAGDPLLAQAALHSSQHPAIRKMLPLSLLSHNLNLFVSAVLSFDSTEVVEAMLQHRVQPGAKDIQSYLCHFSSPMIKFFIEKEIIAKDTQEATKILNDFTVPLNLEIMQLLVDRKADVNALDRYDRNSLHTVVNRLFDTSSPEKCQDATNQIKFLIENGADAKAKWGGRSLLQWARKIYLIRYKEHPFNFLFSYCETYPIQGQYQDSRNANQVMSERLAPIFNTGLSAIIQIPLLEGNLLLNDLINIVISYIDISAWLMACTSQTAVADQALEIIFRFRYPNAPEAAQILAQGAITILDDKPTQEKFRERWRRLTAGEEAPPVSTKPHTYRLWCEARNTTTQTTQLTSLNKSG